MSQGIACLWPETKVRNFGIPGSILRLEVRDYLVAGQGTYAKTWYNAWCI